MTWTTNINSRIDDHPMSIYQKSVVALCFILNMNDGIDVLLVSFTATEIAKELTLRNTEIGFIFSAGLIGMTIGSFGIAPLGDRLGRRKIFLTSMLCITLGMLSMYTVRSYSHVILSRLITGLGIGGILPTMATIVSEYSNKKNRDFNVGLIQGGWPLGAIFTGLFCVWAVPEYGWRSVYLITGIVSALLLWIVYLFMPESLFFLSNRQPKNALTQINIQLIKMNISTFKILPERRPIATSSPWKEIFTSAYYASTWRLWLGIFFGFITLYTLMSWVPTIAKTSGMPFHLATYVGIALNVGALLGVVFMGIVVSRIGSRYTLLTFLLIAFCIMILYSTSALDHRAMLVFIFLIGFFVQGGFNAFFPAATRIYPSQIRSTGVGLAFGAGRFGAILGPFLFGVISDAGYSINTSFCIFSIPLVLAAVVAYTIPSKNL